MEWLFGILILLWLITRETKETCSLCHCNRKLKHLDTNLFGQFVCDGGCLYVAFITGKPVMKNGQIEVEYNWKQD